LGHPPRSRITTLLHELGERGLGDDVASGRLLEVVYPELRRLAAAMMRRERRDHTLQPTALVHEAYLKLADRVGTGWQDRAHFFGVASRAMRQVLVDHARRRGARKRGSAATRITFNESERGGGGWEPDLLALHDALDRLAAVDARGARVVELRVFGGLTVDEVAQALGVSRRTVDGDWAVARMWLARALQADRE
jgi:RNA polymerase sigma factor (TIGR02999 family)